MGRRGKEEGTGGEAGGKGEREGKGEGGNTRDVDVGEVGARVGAHDSAEAVRVEAVFEFPEGVA